MTRFNSLDPAINEVYLDALGAPRIPDPTTEGDFCRRFKVYHIERLMEAINETRLGVWKHQPERFFAEAVIDAQCPPFVDHPNDVWGWGILDALSAVQTATAGTLHGTVSDLETGDPISRAEVTSSSKGASMNPR